MPYLHQFVDLFLHLDLHLNHWISLFGPWIYLFLFFIIFCETGLVVTPFLPGDSLLFALGAMTTVEGSVLDFTWLLFVLVAAGILGDSVNYSIGRFVGPKIFSQNTGRWLKKSYLLKAQAFYEKYGARTVFLARFLPIIRTFAPFVAGIGQMRYATFIIYNIVGAVSWVGGFLMLGRFFGNMPTVKENFHLVIVGIIVVSFVPVVIELWRARSEKTS